MQRPSTTASRSVDLEVGTSTELVDLNPNGWRQVRVQGCEGVVGGGKQEGQLALWISNCGD